MRTSSKIWWLVLLFAVLTLFWSVANISTRFILQRLPVLPVVNWYQPVGTIWHGGVCMQYPIWPDGVCIQWRWQLWDMFHGDMSWQWESRTGSIEAKGLASINTAQWRVQGEAIVPEDAPMPDWLAKQPDGSGPREKLLNYTGDF